LPKAWIEIEISIKEVLMLTCSSTLDLNQTIPTMNMVTLAVVILLSIGVPIYAFLTSKRQLVGKWQTIFYGVTDFLVVEFFLTNIVLVLPLLIPGFRNFAESHSLPFCLLCVILIGIVSEVGRYFILGLSLKENPTLGTTAMFATGAATTRSFILITWNAIQSLLICLTVNQTGLAQLVESAGEQGEEMLTTLEPLFTASWLTYLASGIDVIANFVLHFSISMLFFAVIIKQAPSWLIGIAIGLRALYELPTYLYSYQILLPTAFLSELCVVIVAAGTGYLGWTIAHQYCAEEIQNLHWDSYSGGKKQTPFPKFNEHIKKSGE